MLSNKLDNTECETPKTVGKDTVTSLDSQVVEQLYRKYRQSVERRCSSVLRDDVDAADAAQDVFLQLMTKGGQFRHEAKWGTWLFRVATNVCYNRHQYENRRDSVWKQHVQNRCRPCQMDPETAVSLKAAFEKTMDQSDSITRNAAVKYFFEDTDQGHIAKSVGLSRMSVNRRIHRFKTTMSRYC